MINMRGEGSSDHNALLLTLQLSGDIPSVFSLTAREDTDILISNLDTHQSKLFKAVECPRVSLEICGRKIQVFLDTGAPFSIYNPPAIRLTGDEFLAKAFPTGNQTNCSFSGATGGRVTAEQNYIMPFKVGDHSLKGCFVVLATHERNLPIFLFGQDILMGPLEGIAVIPDIKHQLDKISVYFGIDWTTRYPCEAIVRLRYPPCLPPDVRCLVGDLDIELLEKYLPTVSNIDPEQLFDTEPLEDDAFIFGGEAKNNKHKDDVEDQNDFCLESEFEGFEDCPIPVVEMGIVFGAVTSTLAADVLIDSGATLNLMSQKFVKQIVSADGSYFREAMGACYKSDLPTVRVASGQKIQALRCVDFQLKITKDCVTEPVRFFVFPDLPVQAIIGNNTNTKWGANLSWKTRSWVVTPANSLPQDISVPWKTTSPHWRAPFKLLVNGDVVVPPRSHSKIAVLNPFPTNELNAVHGTFGYITPRRNLITCMVANGVANSPTWVQVANPGNDPLVLRNNSHICDFHSREEWETQDAFIDPTEQEIKNLSADLSVNMGNGVFAGSWEYFAGRPSGHC
jgi:hypothetical protein